MRRRIPLVPTLVVIAAALLMVRLGVWQLHRLYEKEALLATYAANAGKPTAALAALSPVKEADLYRRVSATCLSVVAWRSEAGRATGGVPGWRHIAACRTGADGPGVAVDMGTSQSPAPPAGWRGGPIAGRLIWAPSAEPLIARLVGAASAPTPMVVNAVAAPGLVPTQPPDPAAIPNNHLSYAVQWFLFAALALGVYGVALRQRARRAPAR